jgi:hypothetical protein
MTRVRKIAEQIEEEPTATTEPPWGWGSVDKYADLRAAYVARDARLEDVAARFGLTRGKLGRIARNHGWPKRKRFHSDESNARRLATCKALGIPPGRKRTRPPEGTDEYRLFRKIADKCGLGAAAAYAELRRGGQ